MGDMQGPVWTREAEALECRKPLPIKEKQPAANEWDELFKILKGQDYKEYRKLVKLDKKKEIKNDNLWDEWFDGSGIKGWWD